MPRLTIVGEFNLRWFYFDDVYVTNPHVKVIIPSILWIY